MKKHYFDINEICEFLLKIDGSEKYKEIVEAINGDTKEDGFRGAMFILPSLIMGCCRHYVTEEKADD